MLSACPFQDVSKIQGTKFAEGRLPGSAGSARVQDYLIQRLQELGLNGVNGGSGTASFKMNYGTGTNIIAIRNGSDLATEMLVIGAHYDHLGSNCYSADSADSICNGATDNAAGVGAVLGILEQMAADDFVNRRSLIVAFWDEEERGLIGSRAALENLPINREDIVTYLNFDILGATILPSLGESSLIVGSESGGAILAAALNTMQANTALQFTHLSAPLGNRSDHQNFIDRGIPALLMTDSIGACYHTAQDDITIVDFDKLNLQIAAAGELSRTLLNQAPRPSFSPAEQIAFADAEALLTIADVANADRDLIENNYRPLFDNARATIQGVVAAGETAFSAGTATIIQNASEDLSTALQNTGSCQKHAE